MTDPSEPAPDTGGGMPDLGGLLGGLDADGGLGGLFAQAQEAMAASQAAAQAEVEGRAGGGVVRIRGTGGGDVLGVSIDPAVVDPDDVEGLEDLVMAALRDLNAQIAKLQADAMGGLGGLDPSSMLGGMFGADDDDDDDDESE